MDTYDSERIDEVPGGPDPLHNGRKGQMGEGYIWNVSGGARGVGGPNPSHNGQKAGQTGKDSYGMYGMYREVPGGPDPLHNGRKGYMGSKT
uniref:Uncharacterized protein n=1 Tax=Vitis vinifera TaxID=29760 RepID=A5BQC9_VITVI|nr:hypothetical protein VITISV_021654 [Vitis vinifera]